MENEYLTYLKEVQKEMQEIGNIQQELEKRKKNLQEIKECFKEVSNYKKEFIEMSIEAKKENYKLFLSGTKKCLCCNHQTTKELKIDNIFTQCKKCNSQAWLVGNPYPCEICSRIVNPVVHHIDGNREHGDLDNLIFICQDCHTAIHFGIGRSESRKGIHGGNSKIRTKFTTDSTTLINFYRNKYFEGKEE